MKRVAYTKKSAKNNQNKTRATIVPKFQVTLNVGDRNTPQKAIDMLKVKKSPSNAIVGATNIANK